MRVRFLLLLASFACSVFTCSAALADGVPVQNASFESTNSLTSSCGTGCNYNSGPIPGWTISGTGGSFEPNSSYFNLPLPNGNIVAYSNGGTISQDLGIPVLPNSTYTLSVFVGDLLDGGSNSFTIALDDGSSTLCVSPTSSSGAITPGSFADVTLTCKTGASVVSGDLTIVLTSAGPQVDFDQVSVAVATPEPNSVLQLAMGLGLIAILSASFRRRLT